MRLSELLLGLGYRRENAQALYVSFRHFVFHQKSVSTRQTVHTQHHTALHSARPNDRTFRRDLDTGKKVTHTHVEGWRGER